MIGIFQYLKGYLRIRVWGFSPERFMNLCSNRDILLWEIVRDGEIYYMCISLKNFYKLRPIVRKTGTRVAILERYGLPFLIPELLQRKSFCAGLFLAVFFWMWSTFYIWDIELVGNYQITNDVFEDFLTEENVRIGMKKDFLDIETLEKEIRKNFPQVTWTSAKLSGTKLIIEIKENDAPIIRESEEIKGATNLVSEYDGVIQSIIVRSGVPQVTIGTEVTKGTVLVEGKVPIFNEDTTIRGYHLVQADADIVIQHIRNFTTELSFENIKKEYSGRMEKEYYLRIGENELKLPKESPFLIHDTVVRESRPEIFEKLSIPIFFGSLTHREYLNVEYEYTLEEAETLLNKKIVTFITSLEEKGVQIIEKNVKIDTNGEGWVVTGEFLVNEKVGISSAIPIEPEPDNMGENVTDE